jgi:hypothetical protein
MASDIDGALRRMSAFLLSYVVDAKDRGELAPGVDEHEASELLARVLMSLTVMPTSIGFDVERPATVRRYLECFAIAGLAPR